eukprot:scaffold6928_cov36-Tisochrysis_lutea.AAC.3
MVRIEKELSCLQLHGTGEIPPSSGASRGQIRVLSRQMPPRHVKPWHRRERGVVDSVVVAGSAALAEAGERVTRLTIAACPRTVHAIGLSCLRPLVRTACLEAAAYWASACSPDSRRIWPCAWKRKVRGREKEPSRATSGHPPWQRARDPTPPQCKPCIAAGQE